MQSGNRALRTAGAFSSASPTLCSSDPSCARPLLRSPVRLSSVRFLSSHHAERRASKRNERARTRAERASPAATSIRYFIRWTDGRTDGRPGALERAKLKGFQFDKALSANFSSEQLTGINSRFFFYRSPSPVPSLLCWCSARSCERRRTRRANFSSFDRRGRPFARLLI